MKLLPNKFRLFSDLVGQTNAIEIFRKEIVIAHNAEIRKSAALIAAQAGCGKTALMEAIAGEARAIGAVVIYLDTPTKLRKPEDAAVFFDRLTVAVESGSPVYVFADEMHELWTPPAGMSQTVSLANVRLWIREATDPGKLGALEIMIPGFESPIPWNSNRCKVIMATNEPSKIKDQAIHSRAERIDLADYSDEEMGEIVVRLVKAASLRADEKTLKHIVRVCRGTARELDHMLSAMLRHLNGKPTVSRADVFTILKERELFPGGIKREEMDLLLLVGGSGHKSAVLRAMKPAMALTSIREALAFLMSPAFKRPLVRMAGSAYQRTEAGDAYLSEIRKEGFSV